MNNPAAREEHDRDLARIAHIAILIAASMFIGERLLNHFWDAVGSLVIGWMAAGPIVAYNDWQRRVPQEKEGPK